MPITPIQPIVIPAKTLDKYWVNKIIIMAPQINAEATAFIAMQAYNDAGETSEIIKEFSIESIMQKALTNPDSNIAKAMYFLLAAIDDEYKAQNAPQPQEQTNE